jgi:hypothetical protein
MIIGWSKINRITAWIGRVILKMGRAIRAKNAGQPEKALGTSFLTVCWAGAGASARELDDIARFLFFFADRAIYLFCLSVWKFLHTSKENGKRSRKNRIPVIASEAKQSKTVRFSRLLRPKGLGSRKAGSLAMTQKPIIFCVNAYKTQNLAVHTIERGQKESHRNQKHPCYR